MLRRAIKNRINRFFNNGIDNKPLLQIINFIEDTVYDEIPENTRDASNVFKEAYHYCYIHYKSSFECEETESFSQFRRHIRKFRSRLPVAGVIIVNKQKQFLCVVQENNRG